MNNTISRVQEKRDNVAMAFEKLLGIEITFDEVVQSSFSETVATVRQAVDGNFMSKNRAVTLIGGDAEELKLIESETETEMNNFGGFVNETNLA